MGLRDIFKKVALKEDNASPEQVSSCGKGKVIPLTEVKDEAFASEAMGKGYGLLPEKGEIYSPADGQVEMVFPTMHAIGLKTKQGAEVLIHIGINTVELGGKGFECVVKQGDQVTKGQLIERFDKATIERDGYDTTVMVIITNTDNYKKIAWEEDSLILEK